MDLKRPEHPSEFQQDGYKTYLLAQHPPALNGNGRSAGSPAPEPDAPLKTSPVIAPKVRFPVRVKITLPYFLLALLVAIAGAYVISRVVLDSIEERYTNQIIEAGTLAADHMVRQESQLLETWRLLAHTQGLAEAIAREDAQYLHRLTLPIAINYQEETIEILNPRGMTVLSLRHLPGQQVEDYTVSQGDNTFAQLPFVRQTLERQVDEAGDKFAGLAPVAGTQYFYVAGPLVDDRGDLVGVLLVGKSLPLLVEEIRAETLAHTTLYDLQGQPMASTLPPPKESAYSLPESQVNEVLAGQNSYSGMRPLTAGSINYNEIIGRWEIRNGQGIGLMGVAAAQTFLVHTNQFTRFQILLLVTVTFLLIIAVGMYLANRITHPLLRMVQASTEVAQGNLSVQVEPVGNDEVAVLSHAFNQMISGLREGSLYRDLLGRTVSPQVREELRQTFASGTVQLAGQDALATVLITDIRDFTVLSEKEQSTTILKWLNEYFGELVPIINAHNGVINGFQGDALLAFFGILPRPLTPQESAYQACQAAVAMLEAVKRLNDRRMERGEPPFITGIGINTGVVTAGGLGSTDRLHYTVIGDTVNTAQRLEGLTREFGESGVIISPYTSVALRELRSQFHLEPLGARTLKGKADPLPVYRLYHFSETSPLRETVA